MERIRILRKHLLCFLLLSLTVISDGWAGSCQHKNSLMSQVNAKRLLEGKGVGWYGKDEITLFSDYLSHKQGQMSWVQTYYCGTSDDKSCNYDMHILVWGPWVKGVSGNSEAKMFSGVHIYKCVDVFGSEDEWEKVCQNCTVGNTIPECGDSQRSWGKVLTTNGYDIYMNDAQDHYDHDEKTAIAGQQSYRQ